MIGIWLGFPLADPIVGLVISAAIVVLLIGTSRDIGRRLLDGVDPELVEKAERTIASVPGIDTVDDLRMRWSGHRLMVEATVSSDPTMPVGQFHELEHQAADLLRIRLPRLDTVRLTRQPTRAAATATDETPSTTPEPDNGPSTCSSG